MDQFNTPVLLLVFNRPDTTAKVLKAISEVKPKYLYIAADGPREGNEQDARKCKEVRKLIEDGIDWDCEVKKLVRDKNIGVKKAGPSAINWFFENVEEGIILEDDTLPITSFFYYAERMLNMYRNNERVMHITGDNFQQQPDKFPGYYFSKYAFIWGWATWKRAWKHYDITMKEWPDYRNSQIFNKWCFNSSEKKFWTKMFDISYMCELEGWDYQWIFSIIKNKGICVLPAYNLVSNIGFGPEATHTKVHNSKLASLPVYEQDFLGAERKRRLAANRKADKLIWDTIYSKELEQLGHKPENRVNKLKNRIKGVLKFCLVKAKVYKHG